MLFPCLQALAHETPGFYVINSWKWGSRSLCKALKINQPKLNFLLGQASPSGERLENPIFGSCWSKLCGTRGPRGDVWEGKTWQTLRSEVQQVMRYITTLEGVSDYKKGSPRPVWVFVGKAYDVAMHETPAAVGARVTLSEEKEEEEEEEEEEEGNASSNGSSSTSGSSSDEEGGAEEERIATEQPVGGRRQPLPKRSHRKRQLPVAFPSLGAHVSLHDSSSHRAIVKERGKLGSLLQQQQTKRMQQPHVVAGSAAVCSWVKPDGTLAHGWPTRAKDYQKAAPHLFSRALQRTVRQGELDALSSSAGILAQYVKVKAQRAKKGLDPPQCAIVRSTAGNKKAAVVAAAATTITPTATFLSPRTPAAAAATAVAATPQSMPPRN